MTWAVVVCFTTTSGTVHGAAVRTAECLVSLSFTDFNVEESACLQVPSLSVKMPKKILCVSTCSAGRGTVAFPVARLPTLMTETRTAQVHHTHKNDCIMACGVVLKHLSLVFVIDHVVASRNIRREQGDVTDAWSRLPAVRKKNRICVDRCITSLPTKEDFQ